MNEEKPYGLTNDEATRKSDSVITKKAKNDVLQV